MQTMGMCTRQEDKADRLAQLAQRIVRHEKLKIMMVHRDIIEEFEGLITEAVKAMDSAERRALSSRIESALFADFKAQFGNTTCFNCEKVSFCPLKYEVCLGCDSYDPEGFVCSEPACDCCLRWELRTNAHLDCPEYKLDRRAFREEDSQKDLLVAALAEKYDIHEGRILRRIDSILQEFVNALGTGRPVLPVCQYGN